jgi:hypothetical protein
MQQGFNPIPQAPFPPTKAIFVGIDVLLAVSLFNIDFNQISSDACLFQAASGVSTSYDDLLKLFESLGSFLKRLEIYTEIPPAPIMTGIIVKIIVELLSVLSLATKQIKQGRFSKSIIMQTIDRSIGHREVHEETVRRERHRDCASTTGSIDPRRDCDHVERGAWSCIFYEKSDGKYASFDGLLTFC